MYFAPGSKQGARTVVLSKRLTNLCQPSTNQRFMTLSYRLIHQASNTTLQL